MTLSALSEPHRYEIVELLRDKPHSVSEIVLRLKLNQPQVSKHLKVLHLAGLVEVRPFAQKRYYQLRPLPFREIDEWIAHYRKLWEEQFDKLDALLRSERKTSELHGKNIQRDEMTGRR